MGWRTTKMCKNCLDNYSFMSEDQDVCSHCGHVPEVKEVDLTKSTFNIYSSAIAGPMNKAALLPSDYKEHMNKLNKAYKAKNKENY